MSVFERAGVRIFACEESLARVDDALDLISACLEHGAQGLLIDEQFLPADFFDLRTRFAGEFLREAARGRDFRAFPNRDEAEQWLASG